MTKSWAISHHHYLFFTNKFPFAVATTIAATTAVAITTNSYNKPNDILTFFSIIYSYILLVDCMMCHDLQKFINIHVNFFTISHTLTLRFLLQHQTFRFIFYYGKQFSFIFFYILFFLSWWKQIKFIFFYFSSPAEAPWHFWEFNV